MKTFLTLLVSFVFLSCSPAKIEKQKTEPVAKQTPIQSKVQNQTQQEKENIQIVSGMLRGIIYNQIYNLKKNLWVYTLRVLDVANEDYDKKIFTHEQRLYNPGDLVYVVFDEKEPTKIQKIYLIKKNYTTVIRSYKRTKTHQTPWIKIPEQEVLSLN